MKDKMRCFNFWYCLFRVVFIILIFYNVVRIVVGVILILFSGIWGYLVLSSFGLFVSLFIVVFFCLLIFYFFMIVLIIVFFKE